MEIINYRDYIPSMGILIDIENEIDYKRNHLISAINIPNEKLLNNYRQYLDKNKKYFLYCKKGIKSRKSAQILSFYGYNVGQLKR